MLKINTAGVSKGGWAKHNNMATAHPHPDLQRQPSTSTAEYHAVQACYQLLVTSIRFAGGVAELCDFLFSDRLVPQTLLEYVRNPYITVDPSDKVRKVIDTVLDSIARDPNNYQKFLTILKKSDQWSKDVVKKLEELYRDECLQIQPAQPFSDSVHGGCGPNLTKVYVGSLPSFANEVSLQQHFSSFKEKIVKIEINTKSMRKSKGYGFVFFSDRKSAEAAVSSMNGSLLQNKYSIKVELAKEEPENNPPQASASQTPPTVPSRLLAEDEDSAIVSSSLQNSHSDSPLINEMASLQIADSLSSCGQSETRQVHVPTEPTVSPMAKPSPSSKYEQFTVKLTRLPPSLTRQHISDLLSHFGPLLQLPRIIESRNRYALANFALLDDAERAVRGLNKRSLCGYTINVSMKNGLPIESSTEAAEPTIEPLENYIAILNSQYEATKQISNSFRNPSKPSFTIKLTCLPPSFTQQRLSDLLRVFGDLLQPPRIFEGKNRYALANFSTLDGAQKAVSNLDKKNIFGFTINVSMKKNTSGTLPEQQELTRSSPLGMPDLGVVPSYTAPLESIPVPPLTQHIAPPRGPIPVPPPPQYTAPLTLGQVSPQAQHTCTDPLIQRSASYPVIPLLYDYATPPLLPAPHSLFGPPIPQPPVQQTLKLSPADWNKLMSVGVTGRALFHEIVEPYQTNLSTQIITKFEAVFICFTGHPDAVSHAYGRVCAEVRAWQVSIYVYGHKFCVLGGGGEGVYVYIVGM